MYLIKIAHTMRGCMDVNTHNPLVYQLDRERTFLFDVLERHYKI
jgi:hypothetical protein